MERCDYISQDLYDALEYEGRISAVVLSKYKNVLNLYADPYGIITWIRESEPRILVPYGMVLGKDFNPQQYREGEVLEITLSDSTKNCGGQIDFSYASIVNLKLECAVGNFGYEDYLGILSCMRRFLEGHIKPCDMGEVISRFSIFQMEPHSSKQAECSLTFAVSLFQCFFACIERKNLKSHDWSEVPNILGWGVGLTPSSDDFITGLLSAFYFFEDVRVGKLKDYIGLNIKSTTPVSQFMLRNAVNDSFPSFVIDLYLMIQNLDFEGLDRVMDFFFLHGHTSGMDTLYGIYAGIILLA